MIVAAACLLPYTPLAGVLGFTAMPLPVLAMLVAVVAPYIVAAEVAKKGFYRSGRS